MTLTETVKGTYAVVGQEVTDLQLAMVVEELTSYPFASVRAALSRCRKELRKITLTDILDRLPGGHPGPEEAWGIVTRAMGNEQITLVWTDEMREAYGASRALAGDEVAARMAFKEVYLRAVNEARGMRQQPTWTVSLGHDPRGREVALEEAVEQGRLLPDLALRLLPGEADENLVARLRQRSQRLFGPGEAA